MAECGICLDVLRIPVCVPCGHVHCEKCLRAHISSGPDALKSTCPTCRKPFHIASPDLTFVPQKYHDFMLPTVRKVYMDIPSVAAKSKEIATLTQRLEAFSKENEHLRQRCTQYKDKLQDLNTENRAVVEQEAEAQQEILELRRKYATLKKWYKEIQSRDESSDASPSQSPSRGSSQDFDASSDVLPKVEEQPISLQDLVPNLPRPKRALPKSRVSNGTHCKDSTSSQVVKRQRTHRYSDDGSSSQVVVRGEEEEDE